MPGTCTGIINLRYQDGDEGSDSNPAKFRSQDFSQLKDNCIRKRRLFVDYSFPPNDRSLGDVGLSSWQEVEWLRPKEIMKAQNIDGEPKFSSKGASRFDYSQGSVGNCWFLAAIGSLTIQKNLLAQVVPMDQSFDNYAGIFHFRFWYFGKWVDVVIDDKLPTMNKQLLFVSNKSGNEFWVPLMEKAYAKLCGTYADLNSGSSAEACKDFSGGVTMSYELRDEHKSGHETVLWDRLTRAIGCKSLVCCGTFNKEKGRVVNSIANSGLVTGHAYAVTGVTQVRYYGSEVKLVRLLNPWGKQEWNGDWSDKSDKWDRVSPEDREKCFNREDGEFWMELEDFCHNYQVLWLCCENPNFIDGDLTVQWQCMTYDGSWVAGRSAGGNVNKSTFSTNPQYRIDVDVIDKTEKQDMNILFSLMQKPEQENRKERRVFPTAITIYKIPAGTSKRRLKSSFFKKNRPLNKQRYGNQRDLIDMYSLEPGEYVIIPSTMEPYQNADFVITIYTKTDAKITPHDHHDDEDEDDHDHDHDHDHEEEEEEEDSDTLILPTIPTKPKDEDESGDADRSLFNRYANQRAELTSLQLQKLLNDNFPHGTRFGFGYDTCRSMMASVDTDQRMNMTFTEFSILWKKINGFKSLFHRSDANQNGSLSENDLQRAIKASGIDVNDIMVKLMIHRYSGFSSTSLEEFITLMIRLEKVTNVFKNKSEGGVIHLSWEEFSNFSMYN